MSKTGKENTKLVIESTAIHNALRIYRAIYHPLRLKIITAVHKAKKITVTKLATKLKEDKSFLSQQLKILRNANVLLTDRKGNSIYYFVNYDQWSRILHASSKFTPVPRSKPLSISKEELEAIKARIKRPEKPLFSSTELRIIQLICEQKTSEEISDELSLSKRTVEDYRQGIIKKMNMKNTAGLVLYAVRNKMIEF